MDPITLIAGLVGLLVLAGLVGALVAHDVRARSKARRDAELSATVDRLIASTARSGLNHFQYGSPGISKASLLRSLGQLHT